MGGLFHDIGKKDIDISILSKPKESLTPQEREIYETHPYRGMEILSSLRFIPSDIIQIALQHHENCIGLGFPLRRKKKFIHPMARLVAVTNEFCGFVLKRPYRKELCPEDAIKKMASLSSRTLDSLFFLALMQIFKVTPPSDFPFHGQEK